MKGVSGALAVGLLALWVDTGVAQTNDRSVVEAFYAQLLSSATVPEIADRASKIIAANWESVGDFSGANKSRDQFVRELQGFGKLMPDLRWSVQDILQEGNRYVVRSRVTGTPNGPLFGVPPSGKSFDIMSIDIHTVENGAIVHSYHIEDWAGAMRQIGAK
jgi:predicted ester cyclase